MSSKFNTLFSSSPLQKLTYSLAEQSGLEVWIKRDDLIHPLVSGNKFRKLKYAIEPILNGEKKELLTFGGAFSNHIHACAALGHLLGFATHGIIRGLYLSDDNPTLNDAKHWGMAITPISKQEYAKREDVDYIASLQNQYPHARLLPEGGTAPSALQGVADLFLELQDHPPFDHVICPVGSGGTMAGLIQGAPIQTKVHGICVLKSAKYLTEKVQQLVDSTKKSWQIWHEFHHGGYAKCDKALIQLCHRIWQKMNIPVEPIYSAKMFSGFEQMLHQGVFRKGQRILLIHTGGMQGLRGMAKRNPDLETLLSAVYSETTYPHQEN